MKVNTFKTPITVVDKFHAKILFLTIIIPAIIVNFVAFPFYLSIPFFFIGCWIVRGLFGRIVVVTSTGLEVKSVLWNPVDYVFLHRMNYEDIDHMELGYEIIPRRRNIFKKVVRIVNKQSKYMTFFQDLYDEEDLQQFFQHLTSLHPTIRLSKGIQETYL